MMTLRPSGVGLGEEYKTVSALDGSMLHRSRMLSWEQVQELADIPAPIESPYWNLGELGSFLDRLTDGLDRRRAALIHAMRHETGFIPSDCEEVFDGVLTLLRKFCAHDQNSAEPPPKPYFHDDRVIDFAVAPWGSIAVILPQNAFLYLAVTCLANALAAGNRVALRAPGQSALSATLLAEAVQEAGAALEIAAIVMAKSKEFVAAFQETSQPGLIHYMGSSRHAPSILAESFRAGKSSLIDGDGNVLVYVGPDANPGDAADVLTQGAIRYNGQTCTSINGAIIHLDIYDEVRSALLQRWRALTFGDTIEDPSVSVGPLLSSEQAQWCEAQLAQSGGELLRGGKSARNILEPGLLEHPNTTSSLVREGLFGPALWIARGDAKDYLGIWRTNKYPLCAGVIGAQEPREWWALRLPGVARLVVDGDPSIEDIFEPWGGYLGSGSNPVSSWKSKYQRTLQIDSPIRRS